MTDRILGRIIATYRDNYEIASDSNVAYNLEIHAEEEHEATAFLEKSISKKVNDSDTQSEN